MPQLDSLSAIVVTCGNISILVYSVSRKNEIQVGNILYGIYSNITVIENTVMMTSVTVIKGIYYISS